MVQEVGRGFLNKLEVGGIPLESFNIVPSSFSDMVIMNRTDSIRVKLFDIVSYILAPDVTFNLLVTNYHKDNAYLLVFGGWVPCTFIKSNTILLADRNVVSEIVSRYQNGKKKKHNPVDAFDSVFLSNEVSLDITAFVLEGNQKQIPDNAMIDEQIASVTKSLKSALPSLNITEYSNGNNYYYKFRDMLSEGIKKKMAFFQKVAPKLNKQFTEKSREKAIKLVFCSAEECELEKDDIAVLLAILRITMVGKKTAAQLVLKDSQIYSEVDSYNTVCDLTAIELLVNMHSYHVKRKSPYNVAFVTKDKGLSLLSSLLSNTVVTENCNGKLKVTASITTEIFDKDPVLVQMYKDWFSGESLLPGKKET